MTTRKEHIKNTIERFITSNHTERLKQCTFGVEIETQCEQSDDDGCFWSIVYDNLDRDEYRDMDRYYEDLAEQVFDRINNNYLSELICPRYYYSAKQPQLPAYAVKRRRCWGRWHTITTHDLAELEISIAITRVRRIEQRISADRNDDDLKVKLFNKYFTMFDPIKTVAELDERLCHSIEEYCMEYMDDSNYLLDPDDIRRNHPNLFSGTELSCSNDDVEIVDDQSITGKELRTIDGLSQAQFKKAADDIFDTISSSDHFIDTDCSAHLHVKLADINHCYGNGNLHTAMMEYLVETFERLPRRVQSRVEQSNRWIRPHVRDGNTKYQWIHIHDQGTIEFRLFGNIDCTEDLLVCQQLALEALAYGYQVRFGDYKRKLSDSDLRYEIGRRLA